LLKVSTKFLARPNLLELFFFISALYSVQWDDIELKLYKKDAFLLACARSRMGKHLLHNLYELRVVIVNRRNTRVFGNYSILFADERYQIMMVLQ
jgi:hypothetical protein